MLVSRPRQENMDIESAGLFFGAILALEALDNECFFREMPFGRLLVEPLEVLAARDVVQLEHRVGPHPLERPFLALVRPVAKGPAY